MEIASNPWLTFMLASSVMALGIGLDAAIATLVRYPQLQGRTQRLYWVTGVSLTHTVFPMFGYLLAYFSIQYFPMMTPLVGLFAFALVMRFLYEELIQTGDHHETTPTWITFAIILAVSWDALWSGPAKSAQVVGWDQWMIWLSFIWVGIQVTLLCLFSCYLAKRIMNRINHDSIIMAFMMGLQYTVIGYFGLLAIVRFTFQWQIDAVLIFGVSAFLILIMKRFNREQVTQSSALKV